MKKVRFIEISGLLTDYTTHPRRPITDGERVQELLPFRHVVMDKCIAPVLESNGEKTLQLPVGIRSAERIEWLAESGPLKQEWIVVRREEMSLCHNGPHPCAGNLLQATPSSAYHPE